MAEPSQISAWIALFFGLYLFAAGAGELRSPNTWWAMLKEFERSPGLRFLTGVAALAFGATIYLVNPWRPGDWLSIGVTVLGGLGVAKGMLVLASGERYLRLARAVLGRAGRAWAGFAAIAGLALMLVAMSRLQAF
jgi:hypothetical protein